MIICPKCHKELKEDTKFCDNCGTKIIETAFCPHCGKPTSSEFVFCQNCGASLDGGIEKKPSATGSKIKRKHFKKPILFGSIGAAIIVVLIAAISLISGSGNKNNSALYVKDQEIFFNDLKKDSEAWQLTSHLITGDIDESGNEDLALYSSCLGYSTSISEDGKYIFFPDKIVDLDDSFYGMYTFNLYCREVGKPEAEAIKIGSDVASYAVNTSASTVTYVNIEGDLYQYHIAGDSKDKIDSDVRDFQVSDNGEKIVYIDIDGNLYLKNADKDKEKLASEVSSLEYVTEDLKTIYYIEDNSLYKQVEGKESEAIASNVCEVFKIYDSGEIYYATEGESKEVPLMDYITDDMKEIDASITGFDASYDAYQAKESRDSLRESLKEEVRKQICYSLCFFNGTESVVITDALAGDYYYANYFSFDYTVGEDVPIISYTTYTQSDLKKIKLSDIESMYTVQDMIDEAIFFSSKTYMAVRETPTQIETQQPTADNFKINESGTTVYYLDNSPDENDGDLYRISIKNGVAGKPELYDSEVYAAHYNFINDSQIQYFKDYNDLHADLYIDKNNIDHDVYIYSMDIYRMIADSAADKVFYLTDWDDEEQYGTLKVYQDKESMKIADDVHDYFPVPDGRVLYLCDYSVSSYRGELCEWNDGEQRRIDDDVTAIIPVVESKYAGDKYIPSSS